MQDQQQTAIDPNNIRFNLSDLERKLLLADLHEQVFALRNVIAVYVATYGLLPQFGGTPAIPPEPKQRATASAPVSAEE